MTAFKRDYVHMYICAVGESVFVGIGAFVHVSSYILLFVYLFNYYVKFMYVTTCTVNEL